MICILHKNSRDLNYHPHCFEKNVYKNNRAPEVAVGGGSSRSGFGFIHSLGYNNIIFVSLYNFSSRNLQGVQLIKYMSLII